MVHHLRRQQSFSGITCHTKTGHNNEPGPSTPEQVAQNSSALIMVIDI